MIKQFLWKVCASKMRLNEIQYTNNCIQKQNNGYFINLQEC